jgi:hypothetical protein
LFGVTDYLSGKDALCSDLSPQPERKVNNLELDGHADE